MYNEYSIIMTTYPTKEKAKQIAGLLVKKRLAACVQMIPAESVFIWDGELNESSETLLLIKSKPAMFDDVKALIKGEHTYEVPEIVQISITDGLPEYLKWIDENVSRETMLTS